MNAENKKTGFRVRHGMTKGRNRLLAALFSQAMKKGIGSEELREVIAPNVIRKRLSKASPQEIVRVIEHLAGGKTTPFNSPFKKGDSGGFKIEIKLQRDL